MSLKESNLCIVIAYWNEVLIKTYKGVVHILLLILETSMKKTI